MKKILLTLAVIGAATFSSFAQTTATTSSKVNEGGKFSIGIDGALSTGAASNFYSFGIGGSIKYEAPTALNTFFTISGGYESFLYKSEFKVPGYSSADGFVPLKAGIKHYFNDGFFGEAQAGISIYTGTGSFTSFAYSPGIGYSFNGGFEAGVRYEAWVKDGTMGQVALRLAYRL
jgi:hypothetical protein